MDDEEEGGQGVPLVDGEEDGEDRGDPMDGERGRGLSVKGGDPGYEDEAEPLGLQNPVLPVPADPFIGMEEFQAEQETGRW